MQWLRATGCGNQGRALRQCTVGSAVWVVDSARTLPNEGHCCDSARVGFRAALRYAGAMPIFLECQRCTACCRWPGQVRVTEAEITRLAAFKGLSERDFIERFTRLTKERRGLALLDKPNGECIFLEGDQCAVQPVKPQ